MKKGKHRCHVSTVDMCGNYFNYELELKKGLRTRLEEDYVCSRLILHAMTNNLQMPLSMSEYLGLPDGSSQVEQISEEVIYGVGDAIDRIYTGEITHAIFVRKSRSDDSSELSLDQEYAIIENLQIPHGTIIYSGSFNPLHVGHVELVIAALKANGWTKDMKSNGCPHPHPPVVFEIPAFNADKPSIEREDLLKRIRQFDTLVNSDLRDAGLVNIAVCVTSRPLFVNKTELFPNCTFVMGSDTLVRLLDPKYYASSRDNPNNKHQSFNNMLHALSTMKSRGCRFFVGGRVLSTGFQTLNSILSSYPACNLPYQILEMFTGVEEADFRVDISSSGIRSGQFEAGDDTRSQSVDFSSNVASNVGGEGEVEGEGEEPKSLEEQVDLVINDLGLGPSSRRSYPLTPMDHTTRKNVKPSQCVLVNMPRDVLMRTIANRLQSRESSPSSAAVGASPITKTPTRSSHGLRPYDGAMVPSISSPEMSPGNFMDGETPTKSPKVSAAQASKAAAERIRAFRSAGRSLGSPVKGLDSDAGSVASKDPSTIKQAAIAAAKAAAERIREYKNAGGSPVNNPIRVPSPEEIVVAPTVSSPVNKAEAAKAAIQRIRQYKMAQLAQSGKKKSMDELIVGNRNDNRKDTSSVSTATESVTASSPRTINRSTYVAKRREAEGQSVDDFHPVLDLGPLGGRKPSSMNLANEEDVSEFMTY